MIELVERAVLDVSAASGLVVAGDELCVVADDEHFLASYALDGTSRARFPLFAGTLPSEHASRKKHKPDLEALAKLPDGRLFAIGSGSTPARRRGALIDLVTGDVQLVDLSALYAKLDRDVDDLNIEGATRLGTSLWLAQRGNGRAGVHALIEIDLARALATIERASAIDEHALIALKKVTLEGIDGVTLGITDLAAHPDSGLLFCAAAEAGNDTYLDGACLGSAVGRIECDGRVVSCERADRVCKLEGIAVASHDAAAVHLWLVADADDPNARAPLFSAQLAR